MIHQRQAGVQLKMKKSLSKPSAAAAKASSTKAPALSKKRRLQQVASQFSSALAAQPLPTEQESLKEIENESLFRHDVEGNEDDRSAQISKRSKKAIESEKPKKPSSKKRLHPSTLQKVNELAENAEELKQKAKIPEVNPNEAIPDYKKPVLKDFWAAGEGGLPPPTALAEKELRGKNPAEVLNEWNIGSTSRISTRKTRTIHEKNVKQKSHAMVPLAGVSYNPAAEDHMSALIKLHEIQTKRSKPAEERKAFKDRVEKLQAEVRAREAAAQIKDDDDADHEDEESSEDELHFPQHSERRTTAQRNREKKQRMLQNEKERRDREKKLLSDLSKIKTIAKEVEAEEKQREERIQKRKEAHENREEPPLVKINGKKVPVERLLGQHPVPEVLAPSQLPDKMRRIPGVGGAIEEHYLKLRMQNVVESGAPKARGRKESKLKKVRKVDKFDLDKMAQRVAQPRFKVPAKLLKSAAVAE